MEIDQQTIAIMNRDSQVPIDPQDSQARFFESEDAFLDDTAASMGLKRVEMEVLALSGDLEWKENFQQRRFECRHNGRIYPMKTYIQNERHERTQNIL